jgi:hypothetical protein
VGWPEANVEKATEKCGRKRARAVDPDAAFQVNPGSGYGFRVLMTKK